MGSKCFTGGVVAAPRGRIQFDFILNGIRYRPSIRRPPSEANLRRARERLESIKHQIRLGTFSFEEEFPDYRMLCRLTGTARACLALRFLVEPIGQREPPNRIFAALAGTDPVLCRKSRALICLSQ
jgi:Arm DNA-binding domain